MKPTNEGTLPETFNQSRFPFSPFTIDYFLFKMKLTISFVLVGLINVGLADNDEELIVNWLISIGYTFSQSKWTENEKIDRINRAYKHQAELGTIFDVNLIKQICHSSPMFIDKFERVKTGWILEACKYVDKIDNEKKNANMNKWERIIVWLVSIGKWILENYENLDENEREKMDYINGEYLNGINTGNIMEINDIKMVCKQVEPGYSADIYEIKLIMDNFNEDQYGYLFEACKFTKQLTDPKFKLKQPKLKKSKV